MPKALHDELSQPVLAVVLHEERRFQGEFEAMRYEFAMHVGFPEPMLPSGPYHFQSPPLVRCVVAGDVRYEPASIRGHEAVVSRQIRGPARDARLRIASDRSSDADPRSFMLSLYHSKPGCRGNHFRGSESHDRATGSLQPYSPKFRG